MTDFVIPNVSSQKKGVQAHFDRLSAPEPSILSLSKDAFNHWQL
jgi:hypothetical protein